MSKTVRTLSALGAGAFCLSLFAATGDLSAQTPAAKVPDFSGTWQRNDQPYMQFLEPVEGRGPLREHPVQKRHPTQGDNKPFIGDSSDPLLKPWAQAVIKDKAYRQIVEQEEILPAHSLCWPAGVPGNLRLREPVQFLQEKNMITIIYQRDHQVRRIYLDVPHSPNPKVSWYGESVGHYEGDTLVVDTVGLDARSMVDWYGTPHTDAMHVVERYRMIDGGQRMEVTFTVTDPNTFTQPWTARVHYRRGVANIEEIVCAENNKNASTAQDYPVPMASKLDF
jgi:hypothetical protein